MFNKDNKIHEALLSKVSSHLLEAEKVLDTTRFAKTTYVLTQFRLIIMTSTSKKGKNAQIKSVYFNTIVSVNYSDMATKRNPYDKLTLQVNGTIGSRYDLLLPTEFAHKAYNEINTTKVVVR